MFEWVCLDSMASFCSVLKSQLCTEWKNRENMLVLLWELILSFLPPFLPSFLPRPPISPNKPLLKAYYVSDYLLSPAKCVPFSVKCKQMNDHRTFIQPVCSLENRVLCTRLHGQSGRTGLCCQDHISPWSHPVPHLDSIKKSLESLSVTSG